MYLANSNKILHISRLWCVQNSVVVGRARLQTVGREIWRRPFTRKQTAKISTPDRQPWHHRLMFPQSVNEPVTSPRTVLTYPDRRPLSLHKPNCNRFNYCERPSLSHDLDTSINPPFFLVVMRKNLHNRAKLQPFHALIMCSTNTHPNTSYKMWRKNIHYNLFPHFHAI